MTNRFKPVYLNPNSVAMELDPDGAYVRYDDVMGLLETVAPAATHKPVSPLEMTSWGNPDWIDVGEEVRKIGGDYTFEGVVVSIFPKKSGAIRYVVEDDRGVLHVYSRKNLERK